MGNEVSGPVSASEAAEAAGTPSSSGPVLTAGPAKAAAEELKPAEDAHSQRSSFTGSSQTPTPRALVLVGPSGVGKNTLIHKLTQGSTQFGFSISHTTRPPRPGEKHGREYFFVSKELFCKEVAEGKFLEHAEVHGRLYGTSVYSVQAVLDEGRVCILDVDVQGARQLRRSGLKAIFVFIAPPSLEDLARRLAGRGTETAEQIRLRMDNAKAEIHSLNEKGLYDYLVINDDLQAATAKLRQIAARAAGGMDPEPGQVPEAVIIEEAPLPDLAELIREQQSLSPGSGQQLPYSPHPAAEQCVQEQLQHGGAHAESTQQQQQQPQSQQEEAQDAHHSRSADMLGGQAAAQKLDNPVLVVESAVSGSSQIAPSSAANGHASSQPSTTGPSTTPHPSPDVLDATSTDTGVPFPDPVIASSSLPNSSLPDAGMERWTGKVALVTGASSGIGMAVCEALAVLGMRVVAVARRTERLEQLQHHMHKILRVPVNCFLPVVCDITKDAEVATLPRIVSKRWPDHGIDVLINNAGLSRNDASIFEGSVASWVEMLSTNVLGTCMCTRAVLQDMMRRGVYGHIVNMVGLSGHRIPDGPQGGGFYCGTKAAVKTITEGLRQEARGRGVPLRVSAISPGIVETEFFAVRAFGDTNAIKQATSQFKCLEPRDVAQAIIWCLSAPDHMEVNDVVVRPSAQLL